jgi:hypothetical protein
MFSKPLIFSLMPATRKIIQVPKLVDAVGFLPWVSKMPQAIVTSDRKTVNSAKKLSWMK